MNFQKTYASDMIKRGDLIFLFTSVETLRQATLGNRQGKRKFTTYLDFLLKNLCGGNIQSDFIRYNYKDSDFICLSIDKRRKKVVGFSFIKKHFRKLDPCLKQNDDDIQFKDWVANENEMYVELLCADNEKESKCDRIIGVGGMLSIAVHLFIKRNFPTVEQTKLSAINDENVLKFWEKFGYVLRNDSCGGTPRDNDDGLYVFKDPLPKDIECKNVEFFGKRMKFCMDELSLLLQNYSPQISTRDVAISSIDFAKEFQVKMALGLS
jgi:hypothetical protein